MSDNIPVREQQAVGSSGSEDSLLESVPVPVTHSDTEHEQSFDDFPQSLIQPSEETAEGESRLLLGRHGTISTPSQQHDDFSGFKSSYSKDARSGFSMSSTLPEEDELSNFPPSHNQNPDIGVGGRGQNTEQGRSEECSISNFFAEPSPSDIAKYEDKVYNLIKRDMDKFSNANGVLAAFTNSCCPLANKALKNVNLSSETVSMAMDRNGYVTCTFDECTKAEFLAIFSVLATRLYYPASYKMLFIHILGHGQKDFVGLKDGFVSKNKLKSFFESPASPGLSQLQKVIFFDSCRTEFSESPPVDPLPAIENLMVFHSTGVNRRAYHVDDEGMGVATSELVKLLNQEVSRSFGDLLAELIRVVKERYQEIHLKHPDLNEEDFCSLCPEFCCNLDRFPNLYDDKLTGMRPYGYGLTKDPSSGGYVLSFKDSPHANHYKLMTYYVSILSYSSTEWTKMKETKKTELELSYDQIDGVKFQIGATYDDGGIAPTDVIGTEKPIFCSSNDVDPVKVVTCGRENPFMFWQECLNMFLLKESHNCYAKVWRRPISRIEDDWEEVDSIFCSANHPYMHIISLQPYNPQSHNFAVSYEVEGVEGLSGLQVLAEEHHNTNHSCLLEQSQITKSDDEVKISWGVSARSELLQESIMSFKIKARSDESQQWYMFKDDIPANTKELLILPEEAENKHFKVELHVTTDGFSWHESKIAELVEKQEIREKFNWKRLCQVVCLLLLILKLVLISVGTVIALRIWKIPSSIYQAHTSDVIDCLDLTNSFQYILYDGVIVTVKKMEFDNDVMEIEVFSVHEDMVHLHYINWNGATTLPFMKFSDAQPFLIPDDYSNRPWYMRKNSNITFSVTMQYENPPSKSLLYLFKGELATNAYLRNPNSIPRYIEKLDLLTDDLVFTIKESGYYYVVADITSEHELHFSVNVMFNIMYIDADDYKDILKGVISEDGDTVSVPISIKGNERVLCSLPLLPNNSYDSPTTHVVLTYSFRGHTVTVSVFILVVINVIVIAFIVCLYKLCKKYHLCSLKCCKWCKYGSSCSDYELLV